MKKIKSYKIFEHYEDLTTIESTDYYAFLIDIIKLVAPYLVKTALKKGIFNKRYIKYDRTTLIINDKKDYILMVNQYNDYYNNQDGHLHQFSETLLNKSYELLDFNDIKLTTERIFDFNELFLLIDKYNVTFIYNNIKIKSKKHFFALKKIEKFNI